MGIVHKISGNREKFRFPFHQAVNRETDVIASAKPALVEVGQVADREPRETGIEVEDPNFDFHNLQVV